MIGPIGQIYVDEDTETPAWVSIRTGLYGNAESLAPLHGAHLHGKNILIRYHRSQVELATRADPHDAVLTDSEERRLHKHYGITPGTHLA